ncbi:MAG TPA: folylpolyglutamate synthase/dihydrofolate synthase family protein, partial [Thermoanaerobaculia bacterium]|nr:folylpolyglutamate synthase/dihydrofolate synthase family protein [Thermoanaerobaculia bacterium]
MNHPALARLDALGMRGVKLGLDAIREILARLGEPQRASPHVLIAGTNGKGSTAATLSAILRAAGVRAGLHTSPHLAEVTERVRVADVDVSPEQLDDALARVFSAAARPPAVGPTYFESVTAAAEMIFAAERCGAAVVEVGMGGRLDATNAADPVVSAVTSIALDHVADLGPTPAAIAREKAGVFRAGRPALCAATDPEARAVLREQAMRVGAEFVDVPAATRVSDRRETALGQKFTLETAAARYRIETPLRGAHQTSNVAVAVVAAERLRAFLPGITAAAIAEGVRGTRWPARLERFVVDGRVAWLDGCHNPEGARALAAFLASRGEPYDLLFGVMRDKDAAAIAGPLFPAARRIVLAAPEGDRAFPVDALAERLGPLAARAERAASPADALDRLLPGGGAEIVVAGSLFLAGELRGRLAAG